MNLRGGDEIARRVEMDLRYGGGTVGGSVTILQRHPTAKRVEG